MIASEIAFPADQTLHAAPGAKEEDPPIQGRGRAFPSRFLGGPRNRLQPPPSGGWLLPRLVIIDRLSVNPDQPDQCG